jgi:hypothetical protein
VLGLLGVPDRRRDVLADRMDRASG